MGCDTSTRGKSARVHGAKAEVPQEKANGIREEELFGFRILFRCLGAKRNT